MCAHGGGIRTRKRSRGWTLLELLLVAALAVLLTLMAVPAYEAQLFEARRADAMAALTGVWLAQERWFAAHGEYAELSALPGHADATPDGFYQLVLEQRTAAGFLVRADPQGPQREDSCGAFALDQDGPLFQAGYASADCWQ